MADTRFFAAPVPMTLNDVAALTGAVLLQDKGGEAGAAEITGVAALSRAQPGQICFYSHSPRFLEAFRACRATACLVKEAIDPPPQGVFLLQVANPELAFALVAQRLYQDDPAPVIHASASIDPDAKVDEGCRIDAGVVVGPGVHIGARSWIKANTVIEQGVQVGRSCRIGPNCSLSHALIGDRVSLHGGVVIGSDGFGYVVGPQGHVKIPQLGRVIVQDDVEIGANSTIDRGALDDTVIGAGAKIDNLVQIGHNCSIGRHCVIAGHAGISGSVTLGDYVALGGQVGIADHAEIASGVQIAAKSGVASTIKRPGVYGGIPAKPMSDWRREVATLNRLVKQSRKRAQLSKVSDES